MGQRTLASKTDILRLLLRPVLKYCLRRAYSYREFSEAAKGLLVELATNDIVTKGQKVTISRLHVSTGINRREIRKIVDGSIETSDDTGLIAKVVNAWMSEKKYLEKSGHPKLLSVSSDKEFPALVRSATSDVGHRAVLSELVRQGLVEVEDDKARLLESVERVWGNPVRAFEIAARDAENLYDIVEENSESELPLRNHHSRTEFDSIYIEDLPEVKSWLLKEGRKFHEKVRNYLSKRDSDLNPKSNKTPGGQVFVTSFAKLADPTQCEAPE